MQFKQWLEVDLHKTIPPDEKFKNIYVNDLNNPQQHQAWQRNNTHKIWRFEIAKDRFVHFTLPESADKIIQDQIIENERVFAISLVWGMWFPVVQFNHIIDKKKEKLISPIELKNQSPAKRLEKIQKLQSRGWKMPNYGEEVVAIVFQTNQLPTIGHKEEVIWNGPLKIKNSTIASSREAILRLKHTPYGNIVGNEDVVQYY
jgi:hypothetical protein